MRPDSSWQAKADQGYDSTHFIVDWQTHQVVCPQGKLNTCWTPHLDAWGTPVISVKFSRTDCRLCPVRSLCTKSAEVPRHVTVRVQTDQEALQRIRRHTMPEVGSSALGVLTLQPLFVEKDEGKCFCP